MNLHSFTFWEKSPLLLRQRAAQIENLPKELNDYLYAHFAPPFFQFHVLEALVKACNKNLKGYQKPIAMIDVCFAEKTVNQLLTLFNSSRRIERDELLRDFSIWLTEQAAAHLTRDKEMRLPAIYVRCVETNNEMNNNNARIVEPDDLFPSIKNARALFSRLHSDLILQKFYFMFPRNNSQQRFSVQIKTPNLPIINSNIRFDSSHIPFGKKNIADAGYSKIIDICPLVAENHIEIAITDGPFDNITYLWIKHLGNNETWLVLKNQDASQQNETWQIAPEDTWTFVQSGTHIILGRAARIQRPELDQKMFLSGSMVITLEH